MKTPFAGTAVGSWLAAIAAVACLTGAALAGEPVKLAIRPPKDLTTVEAGDPGIDIQLVGIDAAGGRAYWCDAKKLETSATESELSLVAAPYTYRNEPP